MSVDAAGRQEEILVLRQITDEDAWHRALEEVAAAFRWEVGDGGFGSGAWGRPAEPMLEDRCDDAEAGHGELRAELQDFSSISRLAATEELNFGFPGAGPDDARAWAPAYCPGANCFRLDDAEAVAREEARLDAEIQRVLQGASRFSWEARSLMAELGKFRHRTRAFQQLPEEARRELPPAEGAEEADLVPRVPVRLVFRIGERPWLPLFGRHFRRFACIVRGGPYRRASDVLRRVFWILKRHFPEQVALLVEGVAARPPQPLLGLASGDAQLERRQRAEFYGAWRAVFAGGAGELSQQLTELRSLARPTGGSAGGSPPALSDAGWPAS